MARVVGVARVARVVGVVGVFEVAGLVRVVCYGPVMIFCGFALDEIFVQDGTGIEGIPRDPCKPKNIKNLNSLFKQITQFQYKMDNFSIR